LGSKVFAQIGVGASGLLVLALVGKLWVGLLLLAAYGLYRGRRPILAVVKEYLK
jgi:hypothetical protein